jgi:hypothetical protein
MKNKGFTLVELITTFALASVIIILLINLIVVIRNIYSKTNIKTELYINQSNLSNLMNKKINKDNLDSYEECDDEEFCYIFSLVDGENIKLSATENVIKFGDFVYKLDNRSKVVNPSLTTEYFAEIVEDVNDSILIINIPVENDLYPNANFGINLIYQYNASHHNSQGTEQTICKLQSGTSKTTGAEYLCSLDTDRTFYVLGDNEDSTKIDLIMNMNYTDDTVSSTMTWCVSGDNNACNHDNLDPKLVHIQEVFGNKVTVSLPTKDQIYKAAGNKTSGLPVWLSNNIGPTLGATGYWTSTPHELSNCAWHVSNDGETRSLQNANVSSIWRYSGLRPVITISNSLID